MIVVDSSVDPEMPVLVGEIVMYEVLAGFRSRSEVERNRLLLESLILGTWCIETGAELLIADRDFEPMRHHLGLRLVA